MAQKTTLNLFACPGRLWNFVAKQFAGQGLSAHFMSSTQPVTTNIDNIKSPVRVASVTSPVMTETSNLKKA